MIPTELSKPLTRRIGDLIVTVSDKGITLRAAKCRKRCKIVSWDEIARLALQRDRLSLTEAEWNTPLAQLSRLAYHLRHHHT
jgi:hypothetical protein